MHKFFWLILLISSCSVGKIVDEKVTKKVPIKETIQFSSLDGIRITADHYVLDQNKPVIVLCHQARWSRGEYNEIAPKLNALGYNCLAIDQRAGKECNGVINKTALEAKEVTKKDASFLEAEPDIIAAVQWAKKKYPSVILWGSSYSASLVLKVAKQDAEIKKVLSFSPGEYFGDEMNLKRTIEGLQTPCFITCSKREAHSAADIYDVCRSSKKNLFIPTTDGNHGSRALYEKFSDHEAYWSAVKNFLKN